MASYAARIRTRAVVARTKAVAARAKAKAAEDRVIDARIKFELQVETAVYAENAASKLEAKARAADDVRRLLLLFGSVCKNE